MDFIENLMALSREAHEYFGDKKRYKQWLKDWHSEYMEKCIPMLDLRPNDPVLKKFLLYQSGFKWQM